MRRYVWIVLIASFLLLVAYLDAHQPLSREERCAKELGIYYSVDDGVTERIDMWSNCVKGRG